MTFLSSPTLLRRLPSLRLAPLKPRHLSPSFTRFSGLPRYSSSAIMTQDLTHYLADQPPSVVRLEIEKHFEPLNDKQKRYAHFISK